MFTQIWAKFNKLVIKYKYLVYSSKYVKRALTDNI